jgi:hypothetical protein
MSLRLGTQLSRSAAWEAELLTVPGDTIISGKEKGTA